MRARFEATAAAASADDLSKVAFVALVRDLLDQKGIEGVSEKDLEAAFLLADEDKSGRVDVFEFIRIFSLIHKGEVKGLAKKPQRRKSQFQESLKGPAAALGLGPGDAVTWKGADEELPEGTVGKVLAVHDDGDVEVIFPTAAGPTTFTFGADRLAKSSLAAGPGGGDGGGGKPPAAGGGPAMSLESLTAGDLAARFERALGATGGAALGRGAFKALVLELLVQSNAAALASDKDIDAAFDVVDKDKSGTIDAAEFVVMVRACSRASRHLVSLCRPASSAQQRGEPQINVAVAGPTLAFGACVFYACAVPVSPTTAHNIPSALPKPPPPPPLQLRPGRRGQVELVKRGTLTGLAKKPKRFHKALAQLLEGAAATPSSLSSSVGAAVAPGAAAAELSAADLRFAFALKVAAEAGSLAAVGEGGSDEGLELGPAAFTSLVPATYS